MKKILMSITCLVALALTAIPLNAQTRSRHYKNRSVQERRYDQRYDNRVYRARRNRDVYRDGYYDRDGYYRDDRSTWQKHRDKITTAGGAVGGAVIGGLAGGKKGAIIGAIAGGGAAALYTYKIRNKDRRY